MGRSEEGGAVDEVDEADEVLDVDVDVDVEVDLCDVCDVCDVGGAGTVVVKLPRPGAFPVLPTSSSPFLICFAVFLSLRFWDAFFFRAIAFSSLHWS